MSREIPVPPWMHEDPITSFGKRVWRTKCDSVSYVEGAHAVDIEPRPAGLEIAASRVCLCAKELEELAALVDACTDNQRCGEGSSDVHAINTSPERVDIHGKREHMTPDANLAYSEPGSESGSEGGGQDRSDKPQGTEAPPPAAPDATLDANYESFTTAELVKLLPSLAEHPEDAEHLAVVQSILKKRKPESERINPDPLDEIVREWMNYVQHPIEGESLFGTLWGLCIRARETAVEMVTESAISDADALVQVNAKLAAVREWQKEVAYLVSLIPNCEDSFHLRDLQNRLEIKAHELDAILDGKEA